MGKTILYLPGAFQQKIKGGITGHFILWFSGIPRIKILFGFLQD
jgi:hypothetical protein